MILGLESTAEKRITFLLNKVVEFYSDFQEIITCPWQGNMIINILPCKYPEPNKTKFHNASFNGRKVNNHFKNPLET